MKKSELNLSILQDSFNRLTECYTDYIAQSDEKMKNYIKDSCVKRFEYTLEVSWKLMKKILKKNYGKPEEELTVNNIFRLMQAYKYINNWENWRMYYEKRNNTAHEYCLIKSHELISIIPMFIEDAGSFIQKTKEKLND